MGRKRDLQFCESAYMNNRTYLQYYNRLTELAISMFEWQNLPETVDQRFLEMCLFSDGMCVFFQDEVLGYLSLQCMIGGKLNVYRIPMERKAYATNGYQRELDGTNSVIIFNNYLHTNSMLDVEMFSKRLYNLDRAIDVNANAQKTPVLIQCDENQRLTMKNLYKQYEGNEPFIFGSKGLDANGLKVLQTGAPYVADKLYELKTQIWNEALTYLGISNINVVKKERMITDEVTRNQGGTVASRYSRLESRRQACKQINEMFGLNIWVDYREDFQDIEEQQNENEEEKEYRGGEANE
nr:MAG TPA: upper collar protein [Caudoviricetes sp.]